MSHNYKSFLCKANIDKFSKYKQSYENSSKGSSYITVNQEVFMEKNQVIGVIKVSWVIGTGQTWAFLLDPDAGPGVQGGMQEQTGNIQSGRYAIQVAR